MIVGVSTIVLPACMADLKTSPYCSATLVHPTSSPYVVAFDSSSSRRSELLSISLIDLAIDRALANLHSNPLLRLRISLAKIVGVEITAFPCPRASVMVPLDTWSLAKYGAK